MGIVRTSATRLLVPYEAAYMAVVHALGSVGVAVDGSTNPIVGQAERSLLKNRWAATVTAALRIESPTTTVVDWSIDMLGDKHYEVIGDILDAINIPIDDLGVGEALDRLGIRGRLGARLEARSLADYVHIDERVLELAQGVYDGNQGMLVLTTQRVFFFDKGLHRTRVEEFALSAIGSLAFAKKLGGGTIEISTSGRSARIKQIVPGRAETFVSAFHRVRSQPATASLTRDSMPTATAPDLADQIRKLSELRDAGILTEQEFAQKKAELLDRI